MRGEQKLGQVPILPLKKVQSALEGSVRKMQSVWV